MGVGVANVFAGENPYPPGGEADDLAPFGYSLDVLVADDWNAPQKVGGAAAWLGFAGILVPSARHPDGNLVVYINHLAPNDAVELVQREDEDGR